MVFIGFRRSTVVVHLVTPFVENSNSVNVVFLQPLIESITENMEMETYYIDEISI